MILKVPRVLRRMGIWIDSCSFVACNSRWSVIYRFSLALQNNCNFSSRFVEEIWPSASHSKCRIWCSTWLVNVHNFGLYVLCILTYVYINQLYRYYFQARWERQLWPTSLGTAIQSREPLSLLHVHQRTRILVFSFPYSVSCSRSFYSTIRNSTSTPGEIPTSSFLQPCSISPLWYHIWYLTCILLERWWIRIGIITSLSSYSWRKGRLRVTASCCRWTNE